MFEAAYIEEALLRARRAMLIISNRIQNNFLYLYSNIYSDLVYKQRDIYVLWRCLNDTFPYRASYSTYDALINVLISKCMEVDAYNTEYSTINPDYEDIGGGTVIIPVPSTVEPTREFFTNESSVVISDWQTQYAAVYGNFPSLTIYLYNGITGNYSEFSGATETLQYDNTNTLLQTVTFDFGIPYTGYLLIGVN